MKRPIISLMLLLLAAVAVAQTPQTEFRLADYYDAIMKETTGMRFLRSTDPVRLIAYALVDVDGDGKNEVWVRGDDGQLYQGVFALVGDSDVELLADADAISEIVFYRRGVGYHGYRSPGHVYEGASMVKGSHVAKAYCMEMQFNIFSEEQEVQEEDYFVSSEQFRSTTKEDYDQFISSLGEPIEVTVEWHDCQ